MRKYRLHIISTLLLMLAFIAFSGVVYADPLVGSNIEKIRTIDIRIDDRTDYPYAIIGRITSDELVSHKAASRLREKAHEVGADAILHFTNKRLPFGYEASGIAVRWSRSGEERRDEIPNPAAIR